MALPHRLLGKTGVSVPVIGYGTAPLGKIKFMDAPLLNKSAKLLNHAIDQGITYLDTSPDYGSQPKVVDHLVTGPQEVLLPTAQSKDVGVIAMKVYGHGSLTRRDLALRYSLNLSGVSIAIIGMEEEAQIDENVRLAQQLAPLSDSEMDTLIGEAQTLIQNDKPSDSSQIFWLYDIKPMVWQQDSEPAMVAY